MMRRFCDRCGAWASEERPVRRWLMWPYKPNSKGFDLCSGCADALYDQFLETRHRLKEMWGLETEEPPWDAENIWGKMKDD